MYGTSDRVSSIIGIIYASIQISGTSCIMVIYTFVIYFLVQADKAKSDDGLSKQGYVTKAMLGKLLLVNFTNFLCWVLSSILIYTSAVAKEYPISLLFWVTLILTPINSLINPCILRLNKLDLAKKPKKKPNQEQSTYAGLEYYRRFITGFSIID